MIGGIEISIKTIIKIYIYTYNSIRNPILKYKRENYTQLDKHKSNVFAL